MVGESDPNITDSDSESGCGVVSSLDDVTCFEEVSCLEVETWIRVVDHEPCLEEK